MLFVCRSYKYAAHINMLFKQALDHGLILKKFHRVVQINQEAWLKEYIDMNTEFFENKQKLILKKTSLS